MSTVMNVNANTVPDPFALALRYATEPYARGAGTQPLELGPLAGGVWPVLAYDFGVFSSKYGIQPGDLAVSYVLAPAPIRSPGRWSLPSATWGSPAPARSTCRSPRCAGRVELRRRLAAA